MKRCDREGEKTTRKDDEEYADFDHGLLNDGDIFADTLVDPKLKQLVHCREGGGQAEC